MQDFLMQYYLWLKALHVIAVISWMAGMLYLPRLYVYHADTEIGSAQSETFKIMERRLLRYITNPAMIAAWLAGGAMLYASPSLLSDGWMHAKLTAVILLSAAHGVLSKRRREFERDENTKNAKYYRILNEVPTVLMIIAVVMVIVRPF